MVEWWKALKEVKLIKKFWIYMINKLLNWLLEQKSLVAELHWQHGDGQSPSLTKLVVSTKCWKGISFPSNGAILLHRKSKKFHTPFKVTLKDPCNSYDNFHIAQDEEKLFCIQNDEKWFEFLDDAKDLYLLDSARDTFYIGKDGFKSVKEQMERERKLAKTGEGS